MQIAVYDLKNIKLLISRTLSAEIQKVIFKDKGDREKKIISAMICDDEQHCVILSDHNVYIINFIQNKLKATYENSIKMTAMSLSKDLSEIVLIYGQAETDFLLLSYDRETQVLKETAIRRLINNSGEKVQSKCMLKDPTGNPRYYVYFTDKHKFWVYDFRTGEKCF